MNDADRLRSETHDYLTTTPNRDYYLERFETPAVARELAHRVLNARSWTHDLPSFEKVLEAVTAAVRSFPRS